MEAACFRWVKLITKRVLHQKCLWGLFAHKQIATNTRQLLTSGSVTQTGSGDLSPSTNTFWKASLLLWRQISLRCTSQFYHRLASSWCMFAGTVSWHLPFKRTGDHGKPLPSKAITGFWCSTIYLFAICRFPSSSALTARGIWDCQTLSHELKNTQ